MQGQEIINIIKKKFDEVGNPARIPLIRGNETFKAEISEDGIIVDNLGNQPHLKWNVFTEAVSILKANGGKAIKGDAMNSRLGERGLPLDSVEGHIAHKVYGTKEGNYVFRRITPIACILIWAQICQHKPGKLILSAYISNLLTDESNNITVTEKVYKEPREEATPSELDSPELEILNCLKEGEADYYDVANKLRIGSNLALLRLTKLKSKGLVREINDKWRIID